MPATKCPPGSYVTPAASSRSGNADAIRRPRPLTRRSAEPTTPGFDQRTLVAARGQVVEVRLPWALLGFSDPSSLKLFVEHPTRETETTDALPIRAGIVAGDDPVLTTSPYTWEAWNAVTWHERRKAGFDDLGAGEGEAPDQPNLAPVSEGASRSLEMLRQISSTGYLRKRLPRDLVSLQAGVSVSALAATETGTLALDLRARARMQGYEGDPCGECGNYTLVRNGTCMKCNTCGGTSGCS